MCLQLTFEESLTSVLLSPAYLISFTLFLVFSIVFSKTEFFISLKKYFSNSDLAVVLSLVFKSMYVFSHAYC